MSTVEAKRRASAAYYSRNREVRKAQMREYSRWWYYATEQHSVRAARAAAKAVESSKCEVEGDLDE